MMITSTNTSANFTVQGEAHESFWNP